MRCVIGITCGYCVACISGLGRVLRHICQWRSKGARKLGTTSGYNLVMLNVANIVVNIGELFVIIKCLQQFCGVLLLLLRLL